jgi:hypothetical protein
MQVTTIGLDIAKNMFQVHGIDVAEKVVVRKQLRRSQVLEFFKALPPCLVGMEACATAHYWARELTKLGHQVRLMPAKDVKAYVKSSCGVETRAAEAGEVSVAHATPGATTLQGRGGSACQQDGARGLGVACQGRHLLSGAGACRSRSGLMRSRRWKDEVASVAFTNCKGDDDVMRNGRDRRSDNPSGPTRYLSAC